MTESLLSSSATIVGVTRYCEVREYPVVGGTKDPDIAKIAEIDPDLVILDKHENRREDFEALKSKGVNTFATSIASIDDLVREFSDLNAKFDLGLLQFQEGIATGAFHRSKEEIKDSSSAAVSFEIKPSIKALVPIWRNPYMAVNGKTYAGDLLRRIGIEVIGGETEYSKIDLASFRGKVDLILAPSEPYKFTKRQLPELLEVAPRVEFVDGKDLFWWGVRTPAAIVRLRSQLARVEIG